MQSRISQEQLADILDIAEDGILTVCARQLIVLFNRGAAKIFGYTPKEVIGQKLELLLPSRFQPDHQTQVEEFARSSASARLMGERREVFGRRKDGTEFPAEISITKLGTGEGMLFTAIVRDVTKRKQYEANEHELEQFRAKAKLTQVEAAARESETQYRRMAETANEGIWLLDADGRITFINTRMAEMLGYRPEEMQGRQKWDFLFNEDLSHVQSLFERRRAGVREQADVRFRHRDGREVWTTMSASPVTDESGQFRGALDMFTNVTERKQAEVALRESEARLRLFIEHAPAALAMLDRQMHFLAVSRRWMMDYELGDREIIGLSHYDIFQEHSDFWKDAHCRALEGEVLQSNEDHFARSNGSTHWLKWELRPWHTVTGEIGGIVMFTENITERKNAEGALQAKTEELRATTQQLWQAARLAGVGELAASIAHELNNPLGTVSIRVEGMLAKTPLDDPRRKPLEIIEQEVERMAGLVSNLLQFSRAGRDQVSTIDVCEEITKTIDLISHHLRKRQIQVETLFAPGLPDILADRQQLRQVFLNLFTNAADAMLTGGQLTLHARSGELPGGIPGMVIEVADTGSGIPTELLTKVFDPFFTTKDEDKGTGLGLAICKRIVEQHHGTVGIKSEVGRGTSVTLTLPIHPETNVSGLD